MFDNVRRTIIVIGLVVGIGLPGLTAETLTVDKAVTQALKANLGLQGERVKLGIKQREHDLAFSKLYPSLTINGGLARLNDTASRLVPVSANTTTGALRYYTPDNWNFLVGLNAQLTLSANTFLAINQTAIDYDNSKISYDQAVQRLTRDVRKGFYQLLVLQETLKLNQKQLDNAEVRFRQAEVNFNAGLAPELAVLQARVAWENRKPQLADLRVNYGQLLFGFETLLGLPLSDDLMLDGAIEVKADLKLPPAASLADTYLDRRLDVRAANGAVTAAEGSQGLVNTQALPSLILQFSADPTVNNPFDANTKWDLDKLVQPTGMFSVLLSWKLDSLLPASGAAIQRANAEDQVAIARLALEQLKSQAKSEIVILSQRVQKSINAFRTLTQNVEVAKRAYQLTEDAYKSGAKSLLDVEDAELQYQSAELTLLNEKQSYIASLLDLEVALNAKTEELNGTK